LEVQTFVNHWLDVRDKPAFLRRLMDEFVGGCMSIEGDLSRCGFPAKVVLAHDEDGILQRNTLDPRLDFVVLRLEPDAAADIFRQVMAAGLSEAIIHVQIERAGVLELGAYDNFHPDCVVTGPGVGVGLLSEIHESGVLRAFQVAVPALAQDTEPLSGPKS
jgi:hypothetical protein